MNRRFPVSIAMSAAIWLACCLPASADAVRRFVVEDGNRDPAKYFDERPDFIEQTWDIASEGDTSLHFRIDPKSPRGLITRFTWEKPQDFSTLSKAGTVSFDLYVFDPAKVTNGSMGPRIECTLGSRSNEGRCTWFVGSSLLKSKVWNRVVLRITRGQPAIDGSSVNGVPISSDPASAVTGQDMDWAKVNYHRWVIPSTGGVEGYLDNCVIEDVSDAAPRQEVVFSRAEQPSLPGCPAQEIVPPDVRKDAFFDAPDIDFARIEDWKATFRDAQGLFCLSPKQAVRGQPNARIEAKCTGPDGSITLTPPAPIGIARAFDTVEAWVHGHYHYGVRLTVNFRTPAGGQYSLTGGGSTFGQGGMIFSSWMLYRNRNAAAAAPAGTVLESIEIGPLETGKTYLFTLDSMRFTQFDLSGRPAPRFDHAGPPVKIPVDPTGSCPTTKRKLSQRIARDGDAFILEYTDPGAADNRPKTVRYRLRPATGTFSDITIEIPGQGELKPAAGSGPVLAWGDSTFDATQLRQVKAKLASADLAGDRVKAVWEYETPAGKTSISYTFSLMGKTLAIDAESKEPHVSEWLFGHAEALQAPKVIESPYMRYHPNFLYDRGLFVSYLTDWYVSNTGTVPYTGANWVKGDQAGFSYDSASKYAYLPRTDGSRHPFRERFYIAASCDFDEVLPTVSNPPSPFKDVLKKYLWLMIQTSGAEFPAIKAVIQKYVDYGMTDMYVLWHAAFWSNRAGRGPEAFIGRMRNSVSFDPHGGTQAVIEFYRWMRQQGFMTGYYEGYNFYQPIADFWHEDWAAYMPDGNWRPTWVQAVRCKPWAFPELAATVSKARAAKWGANVVYMDGWTANLPFESADWDHRYPQAGKMIDAIGAMAAGYRNMRDVLKGPVFSEGDGRHYRLAGLCDGSYGQTFDPQHSKPTPLFVDFQLLKVHPLCADMGMGPYLMFAADGKHERMDEFVCSEIAFGNMGIVEPYATTSASPAVFPHTLKSYFMVRQLQERYIMEPVESIRYWGGTRFMDTSEALANGVQLLSMVHISYNNGLEIFANCNPAGKAWTVEHAGRMFTLPKGGFLAHGPGGLLVFSAMIDGRRVDLSTGPLYTYVYPSDKPFADFGLSVPTRTHWIRHARGPKAGQALTYVHP